MKAYLTAVWITLGTAAVGQELVSIDIDWTLPTPAKSDDDRYAGAANSLLDVSTSGVAVMDAPFGAFNRLLTLDQADPAFIELGLPKASFYAADQASDGSVFAVGEVEQFYFQELLILMSQSSDAIVAKIAGDGALLWRKNFGGPDRQLGTAVAALSSGDAVVLGSNNWTMPVWGLSSGGVVKWELVFDRHGGDVVALPEDQVAILGAKTRGTGRDFREDAMLWILDGSGTILRQAVVRKDINFSIGSFHETFFVASGGGSIAALTGVTERFMKENEKVPLTLSKFDLSGRLMWNVEIEHQDCKTEPFVMSNGDVLHACAQPYAEGKARQFKVTKYASGDGSASSVVASLPECQSTRASVRLRIIATEGNDLTIVGARPPFNVGESCTWAGRISFQGLAP